MLIAAVRPAGLPSQLSAAKRSWEKRFTNFWKPARFRRTFSWSLPSSLRIPTKGCQHSRARQGRAAGDELPSRPPISARRKSSSWPRSKESGQKAYEKIRGAKPAPVVIDLTGALEDLAESRLRAPMVEPAGFDAKGRFKPSRIRPPSPSRCCSRICRKPARSAAP